MTVDPDAVPWDRVVHFYGRATHVPAAVERLSEDDHAAAERFLLEHLEHQDGIIQATPLAVRLILRALLEGTVRSPAAVRSLLARIEAAARFQLENQMGPPTASDWSLFEPERLWPPFVSEEDDESLWEEHSPSEEELLGWAQLIVNLLEGTDWREG